MKAERKITKTEAILLGLTTIFLCSLLMVHCYEQRKINEGGVQTDIAVSQETFLPDTSPVDLNTATAEELMDLPGIGEELTRRILEYRDERGGFQAAEELMEVSGIGEGKFAALKDRVTVTGGTSK